MTEMSNEEERMAANPVPFGEYNENSLIDLDRNMEQDSDK